MNHVCPNCKSQSFSFKQVLAANSEHGVACPACGTLLVTPPWPRRIASLIPFLPLWAFLAWKFSTHPPDIPERYAFETAMTFMVVFGVGYLVIFMLFVPLIRKHSEIQLTLK